MISIIIPVFNEEEYLKFCLDSIICQYNDGNLEVIVIDDASTDRTFDIAKEYEKYTFIHVYHNAVNRGLSYSRNLGMALSKGSYIMFVDGDDFISPTAIANIENCVSISSPDIIIGMLYSFAELGVSRTYNDPSGTFLRGNYTIGEILVKMQVDNYKIAPSVKYIVAKDFVKKNKLHFSPIYHEDQLWSPTILVKSQNVEFLNNYFYHYRLHDYGLSQNLSFPVSRDYLYTINCLIKLSEYINDNDKKNFLLMRAGYLFEKIYASINNFSRGEMMVMGYLLNDYSENVERCKGYIKCETYEQIKRYMFK